VITNLRRRFRIFLRLQIAFFPDPSPPLALPPCPRRVAATTRPPPPPPSPPPYGSSSPWCPTHSPLLVPPPLASAHVQTRSHRCLYTPLPGSPLLALPPPHDEEGQGEVTSDPPSPTRSSHGEVAPSSPACSSSNGEEVVAMEGAISTLLQPLSKLALMMPMALMTPVPTTSEPPPPSPLAREPKAQIIAAVACRSSAVALGS
jgi:hypothetical protein